MGNGVTIEKGYADKGRGTLLKIKNMANPDEKRDVLLPRSFDPNLTHVLVRRIGNESKYIGSCGKAGDGQTGMG